MNYTLSTQAIGAVMLALQNSLMKQSDIVPVLQGFELQVTDAGTLIISNPPIVEVAPTSKEVIETSVQ